MSEAPAPTAAQPPRKVVSAALLIIGNEILSGRTRDANLPYLASELNRLGVQLLEVRVVPDVETRIVEAVNALRAHHAYVFTTGGIGPTHDDITAACIAKAFGVPLERNPEAVARLRRQYENPSDLNEARLRMADIPAGGRLIDNPVSGAPGFEIGNVFVMAGVPAIMQAMFQGIKHRLVGGAPVRARTVATNLAEGRIAEHLAALQARHPEVEIGSYPFFRLGKFGVSLVIRGPEPTALERVGKALRAMLIGLGGEILEDRTD